MSVDLSAYRPEGRAVIAILDSGDASYSRLKLGFLTVAMAYLEEDERDELLEKLTETVIGQGPKPERGLVVRRLTYDAAVEACFRMTPKSVKNLFRSDGITARTIAGFIAQVPDPCPVIISESAALPVGKEGGETGLGGGLWLTGAAAEDWRHLPREAKRMVLRRLRDWRSDPQHPAFDRREIETTNGVALLVRLGYGYRALATERDGELSILAIATGDRLSELLSGP